MQSKNPFSKEQKLFSVITPIFGVTYQHLSQCAEALDKQEYKHFEWIVVFDGPHVKGVNLMKKLIKQYPDMDMKYFVAKHGGACYARNYGVEQAKGEYYAFPGGDCYLYPEALRVWANTFEEYPECNRVWGMYDLIDQDGSIKRPVGNAPMDVSGKVWYEGFKFAPYSDGTFPFRASDWVKWDNYCLSLQDWEISLRMLKRDDFEGKDWQYIPHSFFSAELPKKGGLSDDSHQNWIKRRKYVREKNGIYDKDMCVSSIGAPTHAFSVAKMLDAEFLPSPSFKPHEFKTIYLLGFYTNDTPGHEGVFAKFNGTKIVHWIGTDIFQLRWNCNFEKIKAIKNWIKRENVICLSEAEFTKKELEEVGIQSKVVPIPPAKLFTPMPLPEEFTVSIYDPDSELYNPELMEEIIRSMPDVKFYLFGNEDKKGQKGDNWEQLGYIDYEEWMPKFSCNLRIMAHDGLSLTILQFLTADRNTVTNYPIKGSILVGKDRKSIVEGIRTAQNESLDIKWSKYWTDELDPELYKKRIKGLK